jgi:hypothetical protein
MTWLHNSGWAPRTTIIQLAQPPLEVTNRVLLRLQDGVNTSAEGLLSRLGVASAPENGLACNQLCDLLNERALTLPYPPAAIVSDRATGTECEETDLLTVCTVLAKSSNLLYLRDKEPNLTAIDPSRRVILLIPKNWRRT